MFDFLLKSNNLQNVYTKKEMWLENFSSVKYDRSSDKRSLNQKVIIKRSSHILLVFRLRNVSFSLAQTEHNQASW